jgi:hypothetical protein
MKLEVMAESVGEKEINADSYLTKWVGDTFFAVVADGVGGKFRKRLEEVAHASQMGVRILDELTSNGWGSSMYDLFNQTKVHYRRAEVEEETTLTGILIDDGILDIAQIGDSVAYLMRDGQIFRLVDQQNDRRVLELALGKHPSKASFDDVMGLYDQNYIFPFWNSQDIIVMIGRGIYGVVTSDSGSGLITLEDDQVSLFNKFSVDGKLIKGIQAIVGEETVSRDDISDMSEPERSELKKLFAQITYSYWVDPWVMVNVYWEGMSSSLSCVTYLDNQDVTRIDGFSGEVHHLLEDDKLALRKGDIIMLATDGVLRHIADKYVRVGPLKDYPGADWDYWLKKPDRMVNKFFELYKQDPEFAIREALHPTEMVDDATLVMIKYLG